MNFDVAFGQYYDGDSVIHKLDPRIKIILAIIYIVILFVAKSAASFALLLIGTVALIALSGIPLGVFAKSMRGIAFIVLFTAVINIFWYSGETLLVDFWIFTIYLEGIINALLIVVRIVLLLCGTSLFMTYTTTPIALTDGLERLLAPLKKIKVPVHEFSMMMSTALRFIPTLMEETQKIMNAQKSRGGDFSSGSVVKRIKALIPIIVPLFVSAFRHADELATAMECRCYTGGEGRTRMKVLRVAKGDIIALIIFCTVCAAVVLLDIFFPLYLLVL